MRLNSKQTYHRRISNAIKDLLKPIVWIKRAIKIALFNTIWVERWIGNKLHWIKISNDRVIIMKNWLWEEVINIFCSCWFHIDVIITYTGNFKCLWINVSTLNMSTIYTNQFWYTEHIIWLSNCRHLKSRYCIWLTKFRNFVQCSSYNIVL